MKIKRHFWLPLFMLVALLSTLTAGCASGSGASSGDAHAAMDMAPLSEMPAEVQAAPVSVQQGYQFAAANPEMLQQIPCYCGCGNMGHTSNYACYFSGQDEKGALQFDSHALGCSICVDITQDVMRLMKEGKQTQEIRAYVDGAYSRFGPSNIP